MLRFLMGTRSIPKSDQLQSPLFNKLPLELRLEIWQYVLVREYKDDELWDQSKPYYRPDYKGPKRLTPLPQTCKRIDEETKAITLKLLEDEVHTFWFDQSRAPWPADPEYFRKLTPEQRDHVKHVHIYSQLYLLEDKSISRFFRGPEYRPRKITLTIRHADWYGNEYGAPLRFLQVVNEAFEPPATVQELVVELETLDNMHKRQELESIARETRKWRFRRLDGVVMVVDNPEAEASDEHSRPSAISGGDINRPGETVWTWEGKQTNLPDSQGGQRRFRGGRVGTRQAPMPMIPHNTSSHPNECFVVVAITWKPVQEAKASS